MGSKYERLGVEQFGRHLLTSGDLDPVYIALCKVGWSRGKVARWLVAYWCFYHCGVASFISEDKGEDFWNWMKMAAENKMEPPVGIGNRWPRAKERRHFRGMQAVNSVAELIDRYPKPESMVDSIMQRGRRFSDIDGFVKTHRGFGPWISFKVCDMMERVMLHKVDFSEAEVFMFKDPTESALMLYRLRNSLVEDAEIIHKPEAIHSIVEHLTKMFMDEMAPPHNDRPVGLQEIETILCKWKSHQRGHYPLFNDIDEITNGLTGWGSSAQEFSEAMPKR